MKKCTKCKKELPIGDFYLIKTPCGEIRPSSWCKYCQIEAARVWRNKNSERVKTVCKRWRQNHPDKIRGYNTKWYAENREKAIAINAKWRENNPDKKRESRAKYYRNHSEEMKKKAKEWCERNLDRVNANHKRWRENNREHISAYWRNKLTSDPAYRLIKNIRSSLYQELKRNSRRGHTLDLLGCSIGEFKEYIESKFNNGMNWDNYGIHGWHIDHIVPLSYFDLTDLEQQKRACHYTNLQPMWARDNIIKSNNIVEQQLVLL